MDQTGYRSFAAVIDIGHGPGNCSGGWNPSEERNYDIGCSLGYYSVLELCLCPVTPSATVADNKDSMAPRMAMVKAAGRS